VKEIVAIADDEIELREDFLAVNGVVVDRTPLRSTDSLGRALSHARLGRRVVAPEEIWVLGQNRERSWDSRYFGPIPLSSVVGAARPLLTLGLEHR
jgi:signal peptidase I